MAAVVEFGAILKTTLGLALRFDELDALFVSIAGRSQVSSSVDASMLWEDLHEWWLTDPASPTVRNTTIPGIARGL
jgi:hypothetical protein